MPEEDIEMARKRQGTGIVESWQGSGEEDFLRGLVERAEQQVLETERTSFLGAGSYERSGERRGWRNGFKPRVLKTRVGKLELLVPKDREGQFQTELFERYQRSEKALVLSMLEMYIAWVSTRKVSAITEGGQAGDGDRGDPSGGGGARKAGAEGSRAAGGAWRGDPGGVRAAGTRTANRCGRPTCWNGRTRN